MNRRETVTFASCQGHELSGVVDLPGKEPEGYALMVHCFTGGKDHHATRRIARELTDRGLAVLRFDLSGLGDSGGELATSTFSDDVADVVRAAQYMAEVYGPPTLLVGHSLGGAAALAAAGEIHTVAAVATIAAPSDPAHVTHLFADDMDAIGEQGEAIVTLAGRPFRITDEYVEDLRDQEQAACIGGLGKPLLILHAPGDEVVGIDQARLIYDAARHPKSFVSLDGADHLLTQHRQAVRVALLIAAWADPYLPETFTPEID